MRQREWLGGGPRDFSRRLVGFRRDHSVRRRCTGTPSVRPSQTLRSAPLAFLLPIAIAGTSQLSKLRDAQCCGGTSTSAFLQKAQRDTATTKITSKSTEVAAALVTDALRAQFTREVDSFGIAGLALELRQQSSSQGVPRFKVA